MLQEGTKNRAALKLADDIDQIGAVIGTDSNYDYSSVSIRTFRTIPLLPSTCSLTWRSLPRSIPKDVDRVRNERSPTSCSRKIVLVLL